MGFQDVGWREGTSAEAIYESPLTSDSSITGRQRPSIILPPDVGVQPWVQVAAGFLLMFNAWGIVLSFGTFQTYYTSDNGLQDDNSPSNVAWIGSIQTFLLLFGGALGGVYFDMGYFRQMLVVGTFLIVLGMMTLSIATKYYQALLAQGVCVGIGMGLLLVPSVGLPSTWFVKHRGIAVGIVSSGASVAGIVLPITLRSLISSVGFPWAARTLGFMSLATLIISISLIKQRLPPRGRGTFVEYNALRQPEFALYISGLSVSMLGFYTFYAFAEVWAIDTKLDTRGFQTVYILPILNAASIVGRLIPCYFSDLIGPLNVQAPAMLLCGMFVLVWLKVHTFAGLMTLIILYGVSSGAVIAMPPVAVASMTEDLTTFGGRMGVMFLAISCTSLAGPPSVGAIIQAQNGSYDGARIFSGIILVAGAGLLWTSRMVKAKMRLVVKV